MNQQQLIEEKIKEFEEKFPCINSNCDGKGSIPTRDSEGDWEQAQCEYCFTVRFPAIKFLRQALKDMSDKSVEAVRGKEYQWQAWKGNDDYLIGKGYNQAISAQEEKIKEFKG